MSIKATNGNEEGLSLEQAARFLGVSLHTLRWWARIGRVSFYRLGRRIVFRQKDLREFLEKNRVPARQD